MQQKNVTKKRKIEFHLTTLISKSSGAMFKILLIWVWEVIIISKYETSEGVKNGYI